MYIPKIAIIGCGTAAQRYYVPVLRRHPGLKDRLYLVDTDRAGAEETRAALGGGTIREDFRDVLHEIQGAIIILPNHLHHPVAMECLGAGVSVLCEKPLAVLPGHAREMIQKARDQGAALCVNNTRRMFPSFREVREIIASGRLGRLESIEYVEGNVFGWPSATGFAVNPKISSRGILMDLGAHVADTICWWLGGRPVLEEMRDDSYGGPESVVRIKAEKDGCKISITLSRLSDLSNRYQVTGDRGRISGRIFDWKRVSLKDENRAMSVRKLASVSRNYPGFAAPIVENFLQVIQGRAQPLISGSDVLDSIEFIHKCYERRERLDLSWDKKAWPRHAARGGLQVRKPGRILVTGATGFIGGRIVEMAHLAQGARYPVRAGVHQWSSAARLGRFPVETVSLDLTDPVRIEHALEGVTHVVHCAKGSPEVTVQGTRNLLDASLKKGVSHVIHLSTADVYGDAAGIVDENSPYHYTGNPYNRMKIDAEKICWEYREKGLPITIFRPSIVYGPFSASWSLRFAAMFLAGEGGVYEGYGEGRCNLVYVDDLARTILGALDLADAQGKVFNINGPEIITWNEYFMRFNSALGLPPLRVIRAKRAGAATWAMSPVRTLGGIVKLHFIKPVKLIAERVDAVDALMRMVEHRVKVTPSSDELKLFTKDTVYSDVRARSTLFCCPDTGIDQGLADTREWVKYLGMVP